MTPTHHDYRRRLEPWVRFARSHLHPLPHDPEQVCFGPAHHGHWAMQAHDTAFAAFAVLSADPDTDSQQTGMSRDEMRAIALGMLRFTLRSHITGGGVCTDGQPWGHTWISALGLERMMHGIHALDDFLTGELRSHIAAVLTSEADWLLAEYPIQAGLVQDNKPESNIWNGLLLHRAAIWNPQNPRADAWREKGVAFLVNGISLPSDAWNDQILDDRPIRERFVGPNFFDTFACNHHRYLNVGYMVICLSNLALFHFACREASLHPPQALYHRLPELWNLVRACHFPDGRLLRIGGDTRVRYCYCQDYAIPAWLLARDRLTDPLTDQFETGWLHQIQTEQEAANDGSFLGRRLAHLFKVSPLYRLRLEGDRAVTLSMGAWWKRRFPELEKPFSHDVPTPPLLAQWGDEYHGAQFVRGSHRFASWTWEAAQKPQGLCLPPEASDMAEWSFNLAGRILGMGRVNLHHTQTCKMISFPGGFATAGRFITRTEALIAEGDFPDNIATTDIAFVALPDDATCIVWQRARMLHRAYLRGFRSLGLLIPNDLWNNDVRTYSWNGEHHRLMSCPGRNERINVPSPRLLVDNKLFLEILCGAEGFVIVRPPDRQIGLAIGPNQPQKIFAEGSLYADEICLHADSRVRLVEANTVLFDIGCALITRNGPDKIAQSARTFLPLRSRVFSVGEMRAAYVQGQDGVLYGVAALFADSPAIHRIPVPQGPRTWDILPLGPARSITGRYLLVKAEPWKPIVWRFT